MHRKRVTCELHDSYFHLMTIKHSISKIEWASNDYITQLSSTSQLNWVPVPVEFDTQGASGVASRVPDSWRRDVVGKATPGRGGPWEPRWSLGTWEVADKMWQITQQSEPLGLRLSLKRTRKTQHDGHKSEGSKYWSLCSVSSSLSHANPEQPFWTLVIKWEVYIFIKKSSCVFIISCVCLCHWVLIIVSSWYGTWECNICVTLDESRQHYFLIYFTYCYQRTLRGNFCWALLMTSSGFDLVLSLTELLGKIEYFSISFLNPMFNWWWKGNWFWVDLVTESWIVNTFLVSQFWKFQILYKQLQLLFTFHNLIKTENVSASEKYLHRSSEIKLLKRLWKAIFCLAENLLWILKWKRH